MKARTWSMMAAAMAVSAAAMGWPGEPPPPPPPPPDLNDCSPGFFKNHIYTWSGPGLFCSTGACEEFVLGQLRAKGPGSGDIRHAAASALNAWADSYYGAKICT